MSLIDLSSLEAEIVKFWKAHFKEEWDWLAQVLFGEFVEQKSPSAMAVELMTSFVPGVVIAMSVRDLAAILLRFIRYPKKMEELTEWMLLVACVLGIVPAFVGAAIGTAGTFVGTAIGGLAGDEAGAGARAVALLLIRGAELLDELVQFLRRIFHGDALKFLRELKFAKYADAVVEEASKFIRKMLKVVDGVRQYALKWNWVRPIEDILERLKKFEEAVQAIDRQLAKGVHSAISEFDKRLAAALSKEMAQANHVVHPNVHAPTPHVRKPEPLRVTAHPGNPLGKPPDLHDPIPMPKPTPPKENLHPQGVDEEPSAKEPEPRRMEEEKVPCFKGDKLDAAGQAEMDRQLAGQQEGLNNMTVQQYMDGRDAYENNGRGSPSVSRKARRNYQSSLEDDLYEENRETMDDTEARKQAQTDAKSQMSTLAALHNPDQVVGGDNVISDFGDSKVNSTIGGQWASNVSGTDKSRVEMLDEAAAKVPVSDRKSTMMNASLEQCK